MPKMKGQEAIEKAVSEHDIGDPTHISSDEAKAGSEEKASAGEASAGADESPASATETTEETKGARASESEESQSDPKGSVQELIDAALERRLGKAGRQEKPSHEAETKGTKDQLLEELAARLASAKTKKPSKLAEIDTTNPDAVEEYLLSKVESLIEKRVGPVVQKAEIRELDNEFSELARTHPDYHQYGKAMARLLDVYPGLPLEFAYRIASVDGAKRAGREEAYASMEKKKAANLDRSTASPKTSDAPVKVKSAREAVLKAIEETGASFGG